MTTTPTPPLALPALPEPAEWAVQLAAQAWCEPTTSGIVMDERLAMVFARQLTRLVAAYDSDRAGRGESPHGDALFDAVRAFRNERALERLIGLRKTAGYGRLVEAWDDYADAKERACRGDAAGWVSVEDRLPAVNEKVMFYRAEGFCFGWRVTDTEWTDDSFQDRDGFPVACFGVTHWQPLPTPPAAPTGEAS